MKISQTSLLLFAFLPVSLIARANGGTESKTNGSEPVINGMVIETISKKPVEGVTVSIQASRGSEKKEIVTDASGNFKIPSLRPGGFSIVLEKKGYKTVRRDGIVIKEGVSLNLNFDLDPEDNSEVHHPLLRIMSGMD